MRELHQFGGIKATLIKLYYVITIDLNVSRPIYEVIRRLPTIDVINVQKIIINAFITIF